MRAIKRMKNRNMQAMIEDIIFKMFVAVTAILFCAFWICLMCIESAVETGNCIPFIILAVCVIYFTVLIGVIYYSENK
jgi:protein-S-isoprenylcysteine O-methyltransferase Ste14